MKKTCNNCGTEKNTCNGALCSTRKCYGKSRKANKRLVTESYVIEQEGDNGNNNSVINGGEITNG